MLSEDPAFRREAKVTYEEIHINVEEGKIKRVWTELSKYPVDEGEDPPTEEELNRIKEMEEDARRTLIQMKRSLTMANRNLQILHSVQD